AVWRDTEVGIADPIAGVLADLGQPGGVTRWPLGGLGPDEVADLVTSLAGDGLGPGAAEFSATLHADTAGNPLFVAEVVHHLLETGALQPETTGGPVALLDALVLPDK